MAYIQRSLSKNEEINEIYKLHWFARVPLVIWLILASLAAYKLIILAAFALLILAVYEWLKIKNLEQGTTNKRVISKRGIISRKTEEMKIDAIETVEIDQGVFLAMHCKD
jgi:uncharacterized membrane protein YdbT with pleckstrin-like domain